MNKDRVFKLVIFSFIAIILLSILYLALFSNVLSTRQEDYTVYFNKTIKYMNKTARYIEEKRPGYDINPVDLFMIHDFYREKHEVLLNTRGANYEELMMVETYLNLSKTVNILYNVTLDLPSIWSAMKKSTRRLGDMDVEQALAIYEANKHRIMYVKRELEKSLEILKNTKYMDYTIDDHWRTVNYTISVINKTLELINEYLKLMQIVEAYRNTLLYGTNQTEVMEIGEIVKMNIDLAKLGDLAGDVANFLSQLLSGALPGVPTITTPGKPHTGGGGGGYGGVSSDD